jgi:predicted RNA-binding protein YlxR (DUF448 family)
LVRIVRTPDGVVAVDETGKRSGRGAYLCAQRHCWEAALTRRQLDRALKVTLTEETEAQLAKYAAGYPEFLPTDLQEGEGTEKGASGDE